MLVFVLLGIDHSIIFVHLLCARSLGLSSGQVQFSLSRAWGSHVDFLRLQLSVCALAAVPYSLGSTCTCKVKRKKVNLSNIPSLSFYSLIAFRQLLFIFCSELIIVSVFLYIYWFFFKKLFSKSHSLLTHSIDFNIRIVFFASVFINHPVPLRSTYQRVRSKPWNFFDITSAYPSVDCFLGILTVSSVGKEQVNLSGKIFLLLI